ncbi:MAG: EamA family transporter [Opitutae bacterium]|nr:EamA family transporter [Opitutae bacterium]
MSPAATPNLRLRAVLMLLGANFFWGLSFPTIKALALVHGALLPDSGTWFTAAMAVAPRFVLATAVLLLWQARTLADTTRREWHQGVLLGLFASAGMLLQNDGLLFTAASTSAFLTQFYAIMIPVWLALRHRRNPGALVWACCALVLAGVAILGRFDWHTLSFGRGEVETLLSSVFFMGQILCLERADFAGNRPAKITLVMFATEAVVFCALAGVLAPSASALFVPWSSLPWLGLTILLTSFCTLGAFTLMNTWQPRISATEAGLIYCVEPIFGSLLALCLPAWFSLWAAIDYPNETATWHLLVGGGLITLANVLLQWRPPART